MFTAKMHAHIRAPIERVWAFIIDYEGYARVPGVKRARILKPGNPERAGVGAIREIAVQGVVFEEEITRFEAPNRLGYRITRSRPIRIDHEGGDMQLTARDGGTDVNWTTTMALPLLGGILTPILGRMVQSKFDRFLAWAKADLESSSRGGPRA